MSDGIYAALSGAVAQAHNLDTISHNLANAPTAGFKSAKPTFQEVLLKSDGRTNVSETHVKLDAVATDFSPGKVRETGNPLDVALSGDSFLVIDAPGGERYTRAGSLSLGEDGTLLGPQGHPVMGQGGAITIEKTGAVHIDAQGRVHLGDQQAGQLRTVRFDDMNALVREGASLWQAPKGVRPLEASADLQSGALEESNVNIVEAMTEMIWVARAYEVFTRTIETHKQIDRRVATELGG